MPDRIATFSALNELPTSVAIVDSLGTIVAVNKAWKSFGLQNGLRTPRFGIGVNYLQQWQSDEPQLRDLAQNLNALLRGDLHLLTFVYPCHSEVQQRWFFLVGVPISLDEAAGAALVHVNISDLLPPLMGEEPTPSELKKTEDIRLAINGATVGRVIESTTSELLSAEMASLFTGSSHSLPPGRGLTRKSHARTIRSRIHLTKRQMQILILLGKGKSNKEIARTLLRSPNTVKLHVSAILKRLKLKSRTEAALLFTETQNRTIAN